MNQTQKLNTRMNNIDLQAELARNASDKQLVNAELEASKKKWVEYLLKNQETICSNPRPLIVKKKTTARLRDFWNKIKTIFGFTPRKEEFDGIEAYLQYRDKFE